MQSNTAYIMTVANSIIGVGILAMPFCFMKCGILLSILLLTLSNLTTRLACHYLLKTSIKARRRNFEFLASYLFGSSGKLMVELCVIGYLMGTCITYFVVVGDLGPQIIAKIFNINPTASLRTYVMIIVTVFCIIPLGLLRNIESLSFVCISSILFFFCLVLKIFFESEHKIISGNWSDNIYWWRPSGITQCLPIFSMVLSCQMQIFEVYESLPHQTLERMNEIIKFGTAICTGVYVLVGFFGYVAFNDQRFSGNILISLSPSLASDIIKMGFVISVAVSFPLVIFPCRASLYSLLYHRSHMDTAHYIPEHRFKYITVSLVLVALIIGIMIPSIELIIGLVGSTIGVAICIMFPASCFIKTNKKNSTEKLAAQFLLVFGFVIMILGTYANLGAIDEQQSGAEIQIERKISELLPDVGKIDIPTKNEKPIIVPNRVDIEKKSIDAKVDQPPLKPVRRKSMPTPKVQIVNQQPAPMRNTSVKSKEGAIHPNKSPVVTESVAAPKNAKPANFVSEKNAIDSAKNQQDELMTRPKKSEIANDAIQKEEQEIAIEANEQKQDTMERTKEILAEVKKELVKQNEETQKLVLEKIEKISQQVENIENRQKNDAAMKNMEPDKAQAQVEASADPLKKLLEPIPLAKLLDQNIGEKDMSAKTQHKKNDLEEIVEGVLVEEEALQNPNESKKNPSKEEQINIVPTDSENAAPLSAEVAKDTHRELLSEKVAENS